jgi:hypothetical protein
MGTDEDRDEDGGRRWRFPDIFVSIFVSVLVEHILIFVSIFVPILVDPVHRSCVLSDKRISRRRERPPFGKSNRILRQQLFSGDLTYVKSCAAIFYNYLQKKFRGGG